MIYTFSPRRAQYSLGIAPYGLEQTRKANKPFSGENHYDCVLP